MTVLRNVARALLPESAIQWLRGDGNSVRHRFWYGPKERIGLALYRLGGGSYLDWYARRMDGFVDFSRLESGDADALRSFEHYMGKSRADFTVAKSFGLAPHHKLHEFGVGFLRTSQHFIEFLDAGNFSGNDASESRINFGTAYLRRTMDIDGKRPLLITNSDNSFDWLDGRTVDFVWSLAVFTHMPPPDIDDTIKNLRKILNPGAIVLFTFSEKDASVPVDRMNAKDWWHGWDFFKDIAARYGFEIENVTEALPENGEYNPATRLAKMTMRGEDTAR